MSVNYKYYGALHLPIYFIIVVSYKYYGALHLLTCFIIVVFLQILWCSAPSDMFYNRGFYKYYGALHLPTCFTIVVSTNITVRCTF
jgi:hypothetical protein